LLTDAYYCWRSFRSEESDDSDSESEDEDQSVDAAQAIARRAVARGAGPGVTLSSPGAKGGLGMPPKMAATMPKPRQRAAVEMTAAAENSRDVDEVLE
jgi:hypothetical protein